MNIIFISNNSNRTKKIALTKTNVILISGAVLCVVLTLALVLNFLSLRYAHQIDLPAVRAVLVNPQEERHQKIQTHLQENLNSMASKLGQMQAQLMQLDALGQRLAEISGIKSDDLFIESAGQGGVYHALPDNEFTMSEFSHKVEELSNVLSERSDKLGALDLLLRNDRLLKLIAPSEMPIDTDWFSSGYGYRIDPFTGKKAFHEGVDFPASVGTAIKAAAAGVVVYSDRHPDYGNMIEIDHGNDLVSRYAHASKRLVELGQVVLQGQKIAEVGSTGRSTGAHLHFEIRHNDKSLNPAKFLKKPG